MSTAVTSGYKCYRGDKRLKKGYRGLKGLQGVRGGDKGLQRVTRVTRVTDRNKGKQGVPRGKKR